MNLINLSCGEFATEISKHREWVAITYNRWTKQVTASSPWLADLVDFFTQEPRDFAQHEGVFFDVGAESQCLFSASVHSTMRGVSSGGLRHWPYATLEAFIRDGLRLSQGMTRKNALARLWWGGGKGIICRDENRYRDPDFREIVYREYGEFVSRLRGCYLTAEDVGTTPLDMAHVYQATRFMTCAPRSVGGTGNPSPATALGVISGMEAALEFHNQSDLSGKVVAMQGAGNVSDYMIEALLERNVAKIIVSELSKERCQAIRGKHPSSALEIRQCDANDQSIIEEVCDIFAPNALGGVLNAETIPLLKAPIVCGAANNQLLDDPDDGELLRNLGILYVPDYVANRMGIVSCANEQYGMVPDDPSIERHFTKDWEFSVYNTVLNVFKTSRESSISSTEAANLLADEAAMKSHPIWPGRGQDIINGLIR